MPHAPAIITEIMQHGTLGAAVGIILFCYIQEDAALILAATLAATGVVPPVVSWISVFFGISSGDFAIYFIALILRRPKKNQARINTDTLSSKELFLCRFVPGLRTVAYAWCGIHRMPLWRFGQVIFWSGCVWTLGVFALIYGVGMQLAELPLYWRLLPAMFVIGLILWWRRHWRPAFLSQDSDKKE